MATWKRQAQERNDQKYFFSGKFYYTKGVFEALSFEEITTIYQDVQTFAQEQGGVDYLQVYTDEQGRKLFLIDQLNYHMLADGDCPPEYNYCTLLFAHEY